ncbi:hypothetical protein ACOMHN_023821 [Nucella lapillus]
MNNFSTGQFGLRDNATYRTDTSAFAESPEYRAAMVIWKICPPFIILMGVFGNIATVFVMHRIKDDNSSQHAILMVLALSDLSFLCTKAAYRWMVYAFQLDLRLLHTVLCKVMFWMSNVSGTTSAWLVTCVTVQRTMAVLWPHRMRVMCTVRRTWVVIATLVLSACGLCSHMLVGMDISKENRCQTIPGAYRYFYVVIFAWVYSGMVSIFPIICQFVCDIILSVTLFRAVSSSSSVAHNTDNRKKTAYMTTVMILAVSCAFLVLTLPFCVYLIWSSYVYIVIRQHPLTIPSVQLVYAIMNQLWYTNSAINFFLYILTGTKFRKEFMSWIRCGAQSPSIHETASEASRGGRHKHHGNSSLSK